MRYILIVLAATLAGCSSASHISDTEDTWVNLTQHFLWFPVATKVMYCRGNRDTHGTAAPICYEARDAADLVDRPKH